MSDSSGQSIMDNRYYKAWSEWMELGARLDRGEITLVEWSERTDKTFNLMLFAFEKAALYDSSMVNKDDVE